jgi:hypothetical protein
VGLAVRCNEGEIGRASLPLLRNLLRLLVLRLVCWAPSLDRNLTATGCLPLSLPVPLRELRLDKSVVLSPPVPLCLPVSVKENDYEQRRPQVRVLPSALRKYLHMAGKRKGPGAKPGPSDTNQGYPSGYLFETFSEIRRAQGHERRAGGKCNHNRCSDPLPPAALMTEFRRSKN